MIGTALAQFEVTSKLGEGGMGEVWLAKDTKLGREVALKVLPEEFARDPERMARFEREAKVLASLNHPNIAHLYGLETVSPGADADSDADAAATTFLVMELVEGEDLSKVIERGAVPVEEAVRIALQIAEALEAAHEQGIVHRDLKPANIKIRPDGTVKVLDFGLAKAWDSDHGDSSLSLSPTMTAHATQAGVILGTAAYMSPEQAAGVSADRRADIWAFGVVLWEMLTGHKLFDGETVSHVLAAVLKDEVKLEELPETTPPKLRALIARCLRKKPRERLQAIGDARIVLEEPMDDAEQGLDAESATALVAEPVARWRRVLPWAAAAVCALAFAAAMWTVLSRTPQVIAATVAPAEGTSFHLNPASPGPAAVSPDGFSIAYSARDDDGEVLLYVRRVDAPQPQAFSDTENAAYPFWSPDSRWIGYFNRAEGTLKKIDTRGGPPITLCRAPNGKGGSWNSDGVIVFAPDANGPLMRVPSAGGDPVKLTEIDVDRHNSHRHPRFLPDGRHLLFLARGITPPQSSLMAVDVANGEATDIMPLVTQAEYANGHLLFVREGALMAQAFDPERLEFTGDAVPVSEGVLVVSGASLATFSASETGILSYITGQADMQSELEWRDRTGLVAGTLGDPSSYRSLVVSPDDQMAAVLVTDMTIGTDDIWIFDLERNLRSRFTFDPALDVFPVWSPDARSLYFASNRGGKQGLFRKDIAGAGSVELILEHDRNLWPSSVSPDGKWLLFSAPGEGTGQDISVVSLVDTTQQEPFRHTEFQEAAAVFSPDGRWVAYHSDESEEFEVYVTPFPGPGRRWQVSTSSGAYPQWSADGSQIVFTRMNGVLMSARVRSDGETFEVLGEDELFTMRPPEAGGAYFSIASDADRVLIIPGTSERADSLLHLLVNWPTALEARR
ncbi:MAG: protein kinase [Thermoanaerobaculales bacterium]|jgi:Tol biopolymer transport system component|nr:protein kinase [Thermoanaerobaculales bacterium]